MLIATWNINSIRARDERLRAFLERKRPDVLCLQELKCEVDQLPAWLAEQGWQLSAVGQKTYNGVAILSRAPQSELLIGLSDGGDGEGPEPARLISSRIDGVRIISAYFPNGSTLGSDKYSYKLRWIDRLLAWLQRHCSPTEPLLLCGDFNVAPEDRDVHDPARWSQSVLFSAEIRAKLEQLRAFGFTDAFRLHHEGNVYSWWDYRAGAFPRDLGLRIDHVWLTQPLIARCTSAEIERDERKGKLASDHAPVLINLA